MSGVVIDSQMVKNKKRAIELFTNGLPSSPELTYLRDQGLEMIFFEPNERPIPGNQFHPLYSRPVDLANQINVSDVQIVFSILPCALFNRFDKALNGKSIVHIALTGEKWSTCFWKKFERIKRWNQARIVRGHRTGWR